MNAWFVSLAILLIIFTAIIYIEIHLSYDVLLNLGSLQLKIFGFIVWKNQFSIIGDYLNFSNEKSKIIKIKLDLSDIHLQFINELSSYIHTKIFPLKLKGHMQICLENAFTVSMFSGMLNLILGIVGKNLEQKFQDLEVSVGVASGYRHNIVDFNFTFRFAIALYDFIWSLVRSVIVVRRKHEKQFKLEQ